jgi:hypothetical protein
MAATLLGFDPWGLTAVLGALTCRGSLKYRLTRAAARSPRSSARILSPEMMKRRLREGAEFFRFLREQRATAQ